MMKISIVTPNYNYGHFIGQTIESVINQDYENIEHIIVDDGSTDNSVEIIRNYQERYPGKIKLIIQKNQGQTKAINVALKHATGEILGWINSDDFYCINIMSIVISVFKNDKGIDAVFGNFYYYLFNEKEHNKITIRQLDFDYANSVFFGFGRMMSSNSIFWKKRLTDEVGMLDESFMYSMDSDYWSRLLYKRKVIHINLPIAFFRYHQNAKTYKSRNIKDQAKKIVDYEDYVIFENSYKKLRIAKYCPIKFGQYLKYYYHLKRIVIRFKNGHYTISQLRMYRKL